MVRNHRIQVITPLRVLAACLSLGGIHVLGFASAVGDDAFVFIDIVFLSSFWISFFSTVAYSSVCGSLIFLGLRGLLLFAMMILNGRTSSRTLRNFSRRAAIVLRRGYYDVYVAAFLALVVFNSVYSGMNFFLAVLFTMFPVVLVRGFIYSSDAMLFVSSQALRGKAKFRSGFSPSFDENRPEIRRREERWRAAEDWADKRTFKLNHYSVFVFVLSIVYYSHVVGAQRAHYLMSRSNIDVDGAAYSSVGPTSQGVIIFDLKKEMLSIVSSHEIQWRSPSGD